MSNTKRIAKNTLMLYFRQILIMLVGLYTVRVVLETLGAKDYGIYNLVAGVVTMFGFLSGSMATASQRYFAFELGRGDYEQLQKTFSLSFFIYIVIAIVVLLLAETIGLWFVNNKLIIPQDRMEAVYWIYQCSIISFLFTILVTPFMAIIIAHEDMDIYAYVSIIEVLLKLGSVFLLQFIRMDKLQLYGILICVTVMINTVIYWIICSKKYKKCQFRFYWDKNLFKEITSYSGWNLFGASVGIFKFQMVNILLNHFFNPVVVAARGIASAVNSAVITFSQNFSSAMRPQIIKHYAMGQKKKMLSLAFSGAKGTYFLMYLFILPLILEMPTVLSIWIKNVPPYAVVFTRLVLIDHLIDSISIPIAVLIQATGRIKLYQSLVGGILLLNLPVSWVVLLLGTPAHYVMIVSLSITFIAVFVRLIIASSLLNYSLIQFFMEVMLPIIMVTVLAMIFPVILCMDLKQNLFRLFLVTGVSIISSCGCMYMIGFNKVERDRITGNIKKYQDHLLKCRIDKFIR
jgi:O-antigen/teichoic acid export membrane protein